MTPTPTPAGSRSSHFAQDSAVQAYRDLQLPRTFEPWARVLLRVVPCAPGDAVLDVATGPGTVARQAAALVGPAGKVTGVDVSVAMLGVGRGWPPERGSAPIEYVEASALSMPLPDAAFDVVYCQQGMQHMTDHVAALREMRRVLKPGGTLGLALWTESPFQLFRNVVAGFVTGGPNPSDFGRDASQLAEALREAGFQEVAIENHELPVTFEGGIPQALQVAESTTAGSAMKTLPPDQQEQVRTAIAQALQPFLKDGAVVLSSKSNIARAKG
ncbi:MAG TPA: class I SAM-dependent methyltransferase [Chloroflexota bacterium]|nr:class I SAM-dependent methyltransferase [Chloroflexota bacterium]